ncbi:MAG: primosomal protein N' [Calditrichaeota bacterium]|nr:primosomal protein N' [Calditrichota bacterium]
MSVSGTAVPLTDVCFLEAPFGPFTYLVPDELGVVEPGQRVRVPFGRAMRTGVAVGWYLGPKEERHKPVGSLLDRSPLLPADLLDLTRWMAEYYLCEWGEVLAAAIPSGLKSRVAGKYHLSEAGRAELWIAEEAGPTADLWRALARGVLSREAIIRRSSKGGSLFEQFRKRGWLEPAPDRMPSRDAGFDFVWIWTGVISYEDALDALPKNALKLRRVVEHLRERDGRLVQGRRSPELPGLTAALRNLKNRRWVESGRVLRDVTVRSQSGLVETALETPELSETQQAIVAKVRSALAERRFQTFLLYGVTGSGKSLIYLEAVAAALTAGRSALVLVPEIALTPQLAGRLRRRFGDRVAVVHSSLSAADRRDIWRAIRSGVRDVVVGARSALFAPLDRPGLIVVDEEHDDSYKQDDPSPRYNARDAALKRAQLCGATVLLGSATPDVVSFHNALGRRYELLQLRERHQGVELPAVTVVKWWGLEPGNLLSPPLRSRLERTLGEGRQAILLVNRRGFSTLIRCRECREVVKCPDCDVSLRYHRDGEKLVCHLCGFSSRVITTCPACGGIRVRYGGLGTQKVERELNLLYPLARVARMDLDTTRPSGAGQEILSRMAAGEIDVLLGTQMVAKGHDFPGVKLAGILAADLEWLQPDYRAVERAFRILTQAAGRTGRAGGGDVVIQSAVPEAKLLRWVQAHDYEQLYRSEIVAREPLGYPPFGRLIAIGVRCPEAEKADAAANALRDRLVEGLKLGRVLGPASPPVERAEGHYRRRLLVKFPRRFDTPFRTDKETIYNICREIQSLAGRSAVRISIDVDPIET